MSQSPKRPRRRSIKAGDAPHYRGPEQIQGYYDAANVKMKRKVFSKEKVQQAPYPEDSQRHFLTLWFSGCREGEAVMLDPKGWTWNEEAIGYARAPVFKKRETVTDELGNPVYYEVTVRERLPDGAIQDRNIFRKLSRPRLEYRDILIPRDYPLAEEFLNVVQRLKGEGYQYMLYARQKFSREPVKDKACTPRTVQNRIVELHPDLFPHAIRALQARYLRDRYGRAFGDAELMNMFKWSSSDMAVYYLGAQKQAEIMGIKRLPY